MQSSFLKSQSSRGQGRFHNGRGHIGNNRGVQVWRFSRGHVGDSRGAQH